MGPDHVASNGNEVLIMESSVCNRHRNGGYDDDEVSGEDYSCTTTTSTLDPDDLNDFLVASMNGTYDVSWLRGFQTSVFQPGSVSNKSMINQDECPCWRWLPCYAGVTTIIPSTILSLCLIWVISLIKVRGTIVNAKHLFRISLLVCSCTSRLAIILLVRSHSNLSSSHFIFVFLPIESS